MKMNYQPYEKGYFSWNGPRSFNRALYGKYYENRQFRMKCFAGDKPEVILYAGMDLGRVFWGVRRKAFRQNAVEASRTESEKISSEKRVPGTFKCKTKRGGEAPEKEKRSKEDNIPVKRLSDMEQIVSVYECGVMIWQIKDPLLLEGTMTIKAVPAVKNHGLLVEIKGEKLPKDLELVSFYGFASGKTAQRGMDAGYVTMGSLASVKELEEDCEKCAGNLLKLKEQEGCFTLHSQAMGWRHIEGYFTKERMGKDNSTEEEISKEEEISMEEGNSQEENSVEKNSKKSKEREKGGDRSRKEGADRKLGICSAKAIGAGRFVENEEEQYPLLWECCGLKEEETLYQLFACPDGEKVDAKNLEKQFAESVRHYQRLSERICIHTPQEVINAGMYAANVAVEGFWLDPVFNHGAWSWDVPILGWRSMYGPILMGMHEEVRKEAELFNGLQFTEEMQVADPEKLAWVEQAEFANSLAYFNHQSDALDIRQEERTGKALPDPEWQLARQSAYGIINSEGRVPFMPSSLNIPMYNMQEVYFDQLLYEWENTGDLAFAKKILEPLKRHAGWETRCFDPDGDGLYENYANFWATDGLFASGGAGSVATAYNYRLNIKIAEIIEALGQDGTTYRTQAEKIKKAFQKEMWSEKLGRMAEGWDAYGERLKHYEISTPSIMHCAEAGLLDDFELYQALCYADNELEHVQAGDGEVVWFTNWVPYVWSVRDAGFADTMHLALSYFQNGQWEKGYRLLCGAVTAPTCAQVCPGGFSQVLEGKGIDFADTTSMYVRTVTEGLYGIRSLLQKGEILVSPHFPQEWKEAQIDTPNVSYSYAFAEKEGEERLTLYWKQGMKLILCISARRAVEEVWVNGKTHPFAMEPAIGHANIRVEIDAVEEVGAESVEAGESDAPERVSAKVTVIYRKDTETFLEKQPESTLVEQGLFCDRLQEEYHFTVCEGDTITLPETDVLEVYDPQKVAADTHNTPQGFFITVGKLVKHHTLFLKVRKNGLEYYIPINLHNEKPKNCLLPVTAPEWMPAKEQKQIPMEEYFNEKVTEIFKREYRSPRPDTCSLQVPLHLVPSDWCHVDLSEVDGMDDSLLRDSIKEGCFTLENGLKFAQPHKGKNICFVSQWDNYPTRTEIPVDEAGKELYVLFAGYTNQMQCGVVNAVLEAVFEDGSTESYELIAPDNFRNLYKGQGTERRVDKWCYGDGKVTRVRIGSRKKEPEVHKNGNGAAKADRVEDTGLYAQVGIIPLQGRKAKVLRVKAVANEIILGIMGLTVVK